MQPSYGYGYPSPPPPMRRVWYGWQTLIVLGVSSVMMAVAPAIPATAPLGMTGFLLGGPIVHWTHGYGGKGAAVLGMNVGGALVGGMIGVGVACSPKNACDGELGALGALLGLAMGGAVGLLTTNIIDVAAFSTEERPDVPTAQRPSPKPRLFALPSMDIRNDRAVFGVMGAF